MFRVPWDDLHKNKYWLMADDPIQVKL